MPKHFFLISLSRKILYITPFSEKFNIYGLVKEPGEI